MLARMCDVQSVCSFYFRSFTSNFVGRGLLLSRTTPPGKMMRNFKAFSQLGETGQLGPFKVNVARFGSLPDQTITSRPRGFAEFLDDNLNLASIVMRNGDIIHEAYNSQRNINSNTPLLGCL